MKYERIEYPYNFYGFDEMTNKQAKQYFEWYMSVMEERIAYLEHYVNNDGTTIKLDYSRDSLIVLWKWFETKIYLEEKPIEEYERELTETQECFREYVSKESLSIETKRIMSDVAVYYGETFRRCFPIDLHWDYVRGGRCHVSYHRPVLYGFNTKNPRMDFDPWLIVTNLARKSLRENEEKRLINNLDFWSEHYS
ncbi:MAG: hypothetical protein K6F14_07305 [Clostridiales bacterium]|nr:hypothetical protein [Clostridiales bacterium]